MRKLSQNLFAFSTDENSETLESSAINDGRSMLAMFLAVLYEVEGVESLIQIVANTGTVVIIFFGSCNQEVVP